MEKLTRRCKTCAKRAPGAINRAQPLPIRWWRPPCARVEHAWTPVSWHSWAGYSRALCHTWGPQKLPELPPDHISSWSR